MEKEHVEILLEEMRSNFQLVLEGHAALHQEIRDVETRLSGRIELSDFSIKTLNAKIDAYRDESNSKHEQTASLLKTLNTKIDAVKDDLTAHRADTEAHPRWQVREPSE